MYSRSSLRCVIRFAVICTILCATLVVLAGISAIAVRTSKALPFDGVSNSTAEAPPASLTFKNGRLTQLLASTIKITETPPFEPMATAAADLDHFYQVVTAAIPMLPSSELGYLENTRQPESTIEPQIPETPESTPQPQAPEPSKPKPQPSATSPAAASAALDDGQIAGLKLRLRLTSDQIEYWPAVEEALRDVARTQLQQTGKKHTGSKINIDVNSPEVQKLIWAAMPLLMRLRSDQKNEVRKLARIIGLEQVASQI